MKANSSSAVHVFVVYKMWQNSCFSKLLQILTTQYHFAFCQTGHKRKFVACVRGHSFLFYEKMFPFGVKANPHDHI